MIGILFYILASLTSLITGYLMIKFAFGKRLDLLVCFSYVLLLYVSFSPYANILSSLIFIAFHYSHNKMNKESSINRKTIS